MPTQRPVEAGAAEPRGMRPPARVFCPLPSSAATPMYMAAEMTTITATIAASKA